MRLSFMPVLFFVCLLSATSVLTGSSCKKRSDVCQVADDCCPEMGRRMVCAKHLEICGKKKCCITEIEEQQEKQAANIRSRNFNLKRFWNLVLDEDEK